MENKNLKCFHHEKNGALKRKGFINGACVIKWDVPCAGTPDSVPEPYRCPDAYIPIYKIDKR